MAGSARPKVSILICTRNRGGSLGGTLASLRAIRTSIPWEALLLDNGSTDNTADVLKAACAERPNFRYLYEAQQGLGAARDTGWRHAAGEIIALSDDDCYFAPDYVDALVAVFDEHADVGVVGGRILLYDQTDAELTIDTREDSEVTQPYTVVEVAAFHGANLSFRRAALEAAGGFDREFGAGTPFPAEDIAAAAAVIWAGYPGRYDPRPLIYHHHGRKAHDVPLHRKKYNFGRGAYYAKYMLRPDTRAAYMKAWIVKAGSPLRVKHAYVTGNEALSALRYLGRRGSLIERIGLGGMFASFLVSANFARLVNAVRRRLGPAAPT
jgi:glycosyltransferase involved in cell wall biosynthesis